MIDHIFSAALAFAVLVGGTAAIGSELMSARQGVTTAVQVVQLDRVVITGRRVPASAPLASADVTQPVAQRLQ